ncbi:MAG: hypothetical protein Q4A01_04340 [Coriobacteriales bacterium]|nr:hypothetical protein [Coriobacteriales bacterium]
MRSQITRRGFVKLATDVLWSLPVVAGGVLATAPREALADDVPKSETSGGTVDSGAPGATIIVLQPSEVGFYVVDMSTSKKTPIPGAHVRVTSRYNGKTAEGDTDELGMLSLDITELTENPNNEEVPKEYCCNASLEVSKEGYRNFKTGILRLHGAKGHYVPTRKVEPRMPYPELVTFDDWDALYTQNVFNIGIKNTLTHTLHIRIVNIGDDDDGVLMLYDKTSRRVLHQIEDFSDDGVLEGAFRYEFLRMDGPNALTKDMDLAIRFECRDTIFEFPLALQLEEAVFDEPTEVKDIVAKPLDTFYTEGVDVPLSNNLLLPNDLPLCGGVFQMWLPEFPVSIFCDPSGYVQLTMKSPSFGYKNDFGESEDNGWQVFPRSSVAEQCSELKAGWEKSLNETAAASSKASGVLSHAKFSPKLTATVNLQFMAIAKWDMEQQYFQGDAVFQVLLNMVLSLTEQFFAGPIPMYINFTFIGQAMANYAAGFTVPLPEGDTRPNLVHVISAIDKYQWDYTNTGVSFKFLIKPNLSVGVGVKGVASVCLYGEFLLTYFIGVTYRGKLDKKTHPLPHRIATYCIKAEVVIEFFLFTRRWTLWEKKNDNWYNNWKDGLTTDSVEDMTAQSISSESLEEFLAGMRPVDDRMLQASQEFELDQGMGGMTVQSAGDANTPPVPTVTGEYREDVMTGPDGEPLPCVVYTVSMTGSPTTDKGKDQAADQASGKPEQKEQSQDATSEDTQSSAQDADDAVAVVSAATDQGRDKTPATGEDASGGQIVGEPPTSGEPVNEAPGQATIEEDEPQDQVSVMSADEADAKETIVAEADDKATQGQATQGPISYAIPSYVPLWNHERSHGLRAMSEGDGADDSPSVDDAPGVAGIGSKGGVRPSLDVRMFDEPIYGNPRVKVVEMEGETIALRIGSVVVNGEPRTRLIATVIKGKYRPTGTSQVLDFPLTQNMLEAEYVRNELYDYEFDGAASALETWDGVAGKMLYTHCLQTVVVSGKRGDATEISDVASKLVFSYIQFEHNGQKGGNPFKDRIYSFVSWPGSKIYAPDDEFAYHCISNVHIEHTSDYNHKNTEYVFYLDRAGNTEEEVLGEGASVRLGVMLVPHETDATTFDCVYLSPSRIREMMGPDNIDPTAYELVFWPTVEDFRYCMIRGLNKAAYFSLYLDAKGNSIRGICCLGITEGGEVLRYWKAEKSDYVIINYRTPKCLSCKTDGQLASVHVKNPYESSSDNLLYTDIGPASFGAASFGVWGDFVYWPTTRKTDKGEGVQVDEYGEVSEASESYEYRIMSARLWNNKFSDPFILAELDHRVDNIVSVSGTSAALTVVSSELEDVDNNAGTMWYTSIPFVRTVTIIGAECEMPFVVPGGIAEFFVTIRNDGNTYVKGCVVQMYDEADKDAGDEWEPCGYAQVGFENELVASMYNPPDANGNPTNAEEDGALAPGKIGVYRALMMIPMEWEGSHRITFVGTHAFYDFVEDFGTSSEDGGAPTLTTASSEPEGIENIVYYQVKPGDIPMDVLTVRTSYTEPIVMDDAPVSVIGKVGTSGPTGGTGGGNDGSSSGSERSTLPDTADTRDGALAGGLAAAGAAVLAYERRRAKNEGK